MYRSSPHPLCPQKSRSNKQVLSEDTEPTSRSVSASITDHCDQTTASPTVNWASRLHLRVILKQHHRAGSLGVWREPPRGKDRAELIAKEPRINRNPGRRLQRRTKEDLVFIKYWMVKFKGNEFKQSAAVFWKLKVWEKNWKVCVLLFQCQRGQGGGTAPRGTERTRRNRRWLGAFDVLRQDYHLSELKVNSC